MTTTDSGAALKRTPLHDIHVGLGAKMVPFAGYEMPVQYPSGITTEHKAVRDRAGLFDVSHMGEFIIRGADAIKFVSHVTTNDVAGLAIGQAHYSSILNERGTFEDDCLVYRFDDHLMMVVNASNVVKDLAHISQHLDRFEARIEDVSEEIALLGHDPRNNLAHSSGRIIDSDSGKILLEYFGVKLLLIGARWAVDHEPSFLFGRALSRFPVGFPICRCLGGEKVAVDEHEERYKKSEKSVGTFLTHD